MAVSFPRFLGGDVFGVFDPFGSCSRSFSVGNGVTGADCNAGFENGILSVTVPKVSALEHAGRRMIAIA